MNLLLWIPQGLTLSECLHSPTWRQAAVCTVKLLAGAASMTVAMPSSCAVATPEVPVAPGADLAAMVAKAEAGTRFVLAPGKHYAGGIAPKDRDAFIGRPGAVISGAVLLGPFVPDGSHWKAPGPAPLPLSHGSCDPALAATQTACLLREDVFIDDRPLKRVLSIDQLHEGAWYQDRTTGEVLLGSDPARHIVEISYRSSAFHGSAHDVTISHLIIEQFASVAQHGAIEGLASSGWIVTDNIIRFNSGYGVQTGEGMLVQSNHVLNNGQVGISGHGNNLLIVSNEINDNNTHNFDPAWEAGATKFVKTDKLRFMGNCVHNNSGAGFWTDIDNRNSSVIGNLSFSNTGTGIAHEISGAAVIADNVSAFNGSRENSPWASQIFVSGSVDTLVWRNKIRVATNHGQAIFIMQEGRPNSDKVIHSMPEYISRGNIVMQNEIIYDGSFGASGYYDSKADASALVLANRFQDNTIVVNDNETRRFRIGNEALDLSGAQRRGQEERTALIENGANVHEEGSGLHCPSNIGPRRTP